MGTLITGIIFMLIGYWLGMKETDRKWIEKVKYSEHDMVIYRNGTVDTYRGGVKV